MEIEELYAIVSRWYSTGQLSADEREAVKAEYRRIEGIPTETRCTTCPDFYRDVSIILRIYLKKHGYTMPKARKYMIKDGGSLVEFGSSIHYINEGKETPYVKILTDEVAERLLELNPDYAQLIVANPDYTPTVTAKVASAPAAPAPAAPAAPAPAKKTAVKPAKDPDAPKATRTRKPKATEPEPEQPGGTDPATDQDKTPDAEGAGEVKNA